MDIVNFFDPRSYDEMEELKKIFYSFFVQGDKIVQQKTKGSFKDIKKDGDEPSKKV